MSTRTRFDKATKKQAKIEERWGQQINGPSEFIREHCELCGRENVVNNYPDRQRRVTTFMGVGYCSWCPKNYKGLIRALKFMRWAAKQEGPVADKARELRERE